MPETKCAAPKQQLRDITSDMVEMLEKANEIADGIEGKLFGANVSETCGKACPPQNVLNAIDRSINQIRKLISRLDNIHSQL
jgi:hypothetical protein